METNVLLTDTQDPSEDSPAASPGDLETRPGDTAPDPFIVEELARA